MVGLGAGSIPRFLHARMPEARLTVVEINGGVIAAARQYFGMPAEDRRLRVVLGDGAVHVPAHPGCADVLMLDGFEDGAHATELCTQRFYDAAYAALREGGALSANFMADDPKLDTWCRPIGKSFGERVLLVAAEDRVNMIVLACRGGPARIAWDGFEGRARALKRQYGLPFDYFIASLRSHNAHTARFLRIAPE